MMSPSPAPIVLAFAGLLAASMVAAAPGAKPRRAAAKKPASAKAPTKAAGVTRAMTLDEARTAVTMLDDAYNELLLSIHHYYPDPKLEAAATTVKRIKNVMNKKGWPNAEFLSVNAMVMNPDHIPREAFDVAATRKVRSGERRVEQLAKGKLRVVTEVPLEGGCFSCHWTPGRNSGKAAISWTVPLRQAKRE
jgi:hypothetical protein